MRIVLICLFLVLTVGCTTTQPPVVTQYKVTLIKPPAAYLLSCTQPYRSPPSTWGEAVRRDPVWLMYFSLCASRIENLRRCYDNPQTCIQE
ncbi:Rz1-like lysis system protein LysC [Photobacterium sp. DNB22_13_2]